MGCLNELVLINVERAVSLSPPFFLLKKIKRQVEHKVVILNAVKDLLQHACCIIDASLRSA
jgi:hypothetical protein